MFEDQLTPGERPLNDRVVVVTGGSRGLGREISRAFAARGATVVVASRKPEACEALAAELSASYRTDAAGVACHVGHWRECDDLADTVLDRFGRVDVLVNNAGMSPVYDSVEAVTEELFDKVLAVNLKGAFRLSARLGSEMAARDGGAIVNISSIAAVLPSSREIPYAMAKAGLNAMTAGLARALGPKVRVNAIMPGAFLTDISKAWDMEAFEAQARQQFPLARGGDPREIVGAVLLLATDAGSYITGSVLTVDGGWTSSQP